MDAVAAPAENSGLVALPLLSTTTTTLGTTPPSESPRGDSALEQRLLTWIDDHDNHKYLSINDALKQYDLTPNMLRNDLLQLKAKDLPQAVSFNMLRHIQLVPNRRPDDDGALQLCLQRTLVPPPLTTAVAANKSAAAAAVEAYRYNPTTGSHQTPNPDNAAAAMASKLDLPPWSAVDDDASADAVVHENDIEEEEKEGRKCVPPSAANASGGGDSPLERRLLLLIDQQPSGHLSMEKIDRLPSWCTTLTPLSRSSAL